MSDRESTIAHCGPPTYTFYEELELLLECRVWEGGHVACVRGYHAIVDKDGPPGSLALNDGSGGYSCDVPIDDAEVSFDVDVKWDGCANWDVRPDDGCRLHTCGMRDVRRLGAWIAKAYEHGADVVKTEEKYR